jgi:hypothetical protein
MGGNPAASTVLQIFGTGIPNAATISVQIV